MKNSFEKCSDNSFCFVIPSTIDALPYTKIDDKAFLSNKAIHELVLPDTIESIGSWAFAHMQNLEKITVPSVDMALGKQVFLDCPRLKCVHVLQDTSRNPGLPYFLAHTVTILDTENLFTPKSAACHDTHPKWMAAYDEVLLKYVSSPDEEGFEPVFYGWFNDEDAEAQLPAYIETRRRNKVALVFTRLLYPLYLSDSVKRQLQGYLSAHMPDGKLYTQHIMVYDCLKTDGYGEDIRYIKILEDSGILTETQITRLLSYLQPGNPEVIAYLLRLQESLHMHEDAFSKFDL